MVAKIFDTYRNAYAGLPRAIWLLSLIMLINRAGTMVIIFFVLYLTDVFDFSNQLAGWIISFSAVGGLLGALFGGWMSDRFGSIQSQILLLALVGIQFFAMLLATTLASVTVMLFVLMFLGESVRPGLHAACLDYSEPENQKRSMGLLRLAINLGMAIGPVLGGLLAQFGLWNWLFILDGATCIFSALLLYLVFGFGRVSHGSLKPARMESGDGKTLEAESKSHPSRQVVSRSPWRDRRMLSFGFFYLLILIVFVQFGSTFVKFLQEVHGMAESQIGLLSSINPILIVIVEMVIIKSLERHSTLKTIAVGAFLICLGFGSLAFAPTAWFCILPVVILTFGEIFAFPLTAAYAAEMSNESNRGQYMGFITVMFSIAMIIGPVLGLSLYEIDPNLPWYAALGVGVITSACLWKMASPEENSARIPAKLAELKD